MKIICPQIIVWRFDAKAILKNIEKAIRVCYKSEDKIAPGTAEPLIRRILQSDHESTIEHEKVTVVITCDRGVTHELVRHRIAAYSQESTRYCNYEAERFGSEITVIKPFFLEGTDEARYLQKRTWLIAMGFTEKLYLEMIRLGASPQEARSVLPNSLKTEIVTTFNLREWRHFFRLRCSAKAHPQMRQVAIPLLHFFTHTDLSVFFEDIPFDKSFPVEHWAKVKFEEETSN